MTNKAIAEQLKEFRTLIDNSRNHSGISEALNNFGYPLENLDRGHALLEKFLMLYSLQSDQYGAKLNATDHMLTEFQQLKTTYKDHRTLARLAFNGDRGLQNTLKLNARLPSRRAAFVEQAATFYQKITLNQHALKRYGVTKAELDQAQAMVTALIQAQQQQTQKAGEAQVATQERNQTLLALQRWMKGYKAIVKVALEDNPQLLEVLGILVKA